VVQMVLDEEEMTTLMDRVVDLVLLAMTPMVVNVKVVWVAAMTSHLGAELVVKEALEVEAETTMIRTSLG